MLLQSGVSTQDHACSSNADPGLDMVGSQLGIGSLEFGVACQRCGGPISRDGGGYVATWNVLQYVFVLLYVLYLCIDLQV